MLQCYIQDICNFIIWHCVQFTIMLHWTGILSFLGHFHKWIHGKSRKSYALSTTYNHCTNGHRSEDKKLWASLWIYLHISAMVVGSDPVCRASRQPSTSIIQHIAWNQVEYQISPSSRVDIQLPMQLIQLPMQMPCKFGQI